MWKRIFAPENSGRWGVGAGTPPARPFLYGPGIIFETNKYIYRNGYLRDYCCKSDSIQGKKI